MLFTRAEPKALVYNIVINVRARFVTIILITITYRKYELLAYRIAETLINCTDIVISLERRKNKS